MPENIHTENTFEDAITEHLTTHGWHLGNKSDFDAKLAIDKKAVLDFVKDTQSAKWNKFVQFYNKDSEEKFIIRLVKELDLRGMLDVVRHGITDSGIKFKLAYFKPDSNLNPETLKLYGKNKLYCTRQVRFSLDNTKSIDLLLSLNGLPIATAELKNQFTGQNVQHGIKQYRDDRDPRELLFQFKNHAKRAIVHFALDSDEVYFTTKLDNKQTRFFPFNKGYKKGAGNPPNDDGYKTAYFWEEVLQKDSWLEIIGRFIRN